MDPCISSAALSQAVLRNSLAQTKSAAEDSVAQGQ